MFKYLKEKNLRRNYLTFLLILHTLNNQLNNTHHGNTSV